MKEYRLTDWLPTTKKEIELRGWDSVDVILFSADAYVDHPSFGAAVIGRTLEAAGYRVAIVPQPDSQEYRNLVYILIIALILLILTDIFQGISEFILSFTRYEENKTLISSAVGIFLALITSYILFNLPMIQTILNAIK